MKIGLSFIIATAALMNGINAQNNQQCSGPLRARREINSLSGGEVSEMISTLTKMNRLGWWSWFTFLHIKFYGFLHDTPEFLPWHRRYTREIELTIQYYQPSFTLPYFDASLVCRDPGSSIIFRSDYFGGNGRSGDNCITDGMANGWKMLFPNNECLKRRFNGNGNRIGSWQCPENVASDIQSSNNYADISSRIEYGIHGSVHNLIGGDMTSPSSPNDFIFFLHHSNIDRLWLKYQNTHPNNRYDYSEKNGTPRNINDRMTVFSEPIIDTFDVGYGLNCYSYDDTTPVQRGSRSAQVSKRTENVLNRRQDLTYDASAISQVNAIPQMKLDTALDADTLKEFFPALAAGNNSPDAAVLPNSVTTKAVDYAKEASQRIEPQSFVASASEASSGESPIVAAAPKTVPDHLKFPNLTHLTDDFITMMHYDRAEYEKYYQRQVALADALNSNGYISPYI